MSSADLDTMRSAYDAFNRGDVATVLAVMAEDVEWYEAEGMPYGDGMIRGPQAVAQEIFAEVVEDTEGFTVTPEQFVTEGDTTVALGRYSGTGKATGRSFDIRFAHVWEMRDGKLARFVQHTDTAKYLEAVPARQAAV
jgi:hypothetical protein